MALTRAGGDGGDWGEKEASRIPGLTCLIAVYSQCSTFEPAYPGLNGPVRALGSWTPGGTGPQLPHLVAGGAFTWNEGQGSQDYIAWWDGAAWSNFGWGPDAPVNAITTWDPDGDGPLTPHVR